MQSYSGTQIDLKPPPLSGKDSFRSKRVLHVYTEHRARGGAERFAQVNMELSREIGYIVDLFTRTSDDLPRNLWGRLQAGVGAVYDRNSVRDFGERLDAFRPDVIHLYDYFPLISPWIAPLCAQRGIPVVMHCVHYRLTCPVATHFTRGQVCTRCNGGHEYRAVLRNCRNNLPESATVALHNIIVRKFRPLASGVSRFIAPSEFTRQWLAEHANIDPHRITTVMPFVDVPETCVDPAEGTFIAFAGRFAEEKGIRTLLESARITGLPFRLCRSADYPIGVDIPSTVEHVVTHTRAELDSFYRGARLLAFPSEWFETFGLVGAESMSHGVPVVAARIGALTNLVEDGVDGLLFEPGNAADLAQKITRLWTNPALCRQFGQAARRKVMDNWTVDKYFRNLDRVYEEVIREVAI